ASTETHKTTMNRRTPCAPSLLVIVAHVVPPDVIPGAIVPCNVVPGQYCPRRYCCRQCCPTRCWCQRHCPRRCYPRQCCPRRYCPRRCCPSSPSTSSAACRRVDGPAAHRAPDTAPWRSHLPAAGPG